MVSSPTERKRSLAAKGEIDGRWPYPSVARGQDSAPAPSGQSRKRPVLAHRTPPIFKVRSNSETGLFHPAEEDLIERRVHGSRGGGPGQFYSVRPKSVEAPHGQYPFHDMERAAGKNRAMGVTIDSMPQRHAAMQGHSDRRFRGTGGEMFGLKVGSPPGLGPDKYAKHRTWAPEPAARATGDGSSGSADAENTSTFSFRSQSPRLPEGADSWMILKARSSDINCDTLEWDDKTRSRKSNGFMKGATILKGARFTSTY
eukprot:TRINITY_DN11239_c0_g1_i2.p1 TRINITY_DN11239_c0_g1~~TRINITY_DN11239_c0_g1_i2.p1  ORF type:complete len:257 (+),score=11.39 TRINITY_DN11239_c0_g1_i2:156-926(+)